MKHIKTQKQLNESSENLNISDVMSSFLTKLQSRLKELENEKLTAQERLKLQQELALATANTTEEEIKRAELLAGESQTERILRETSEKKAALQEELDFEILKQELARKDFEEATAKKEAINKAFFDKYKIDIEDAYNTELRKIQELNQALQETRDLRL